MTQVTSKFRCNSVEAFPGSSKVNLTTVYEVIDSTTENYGFTKATPSGTLTMMVDNPNAAIVFIPGEEYYVTFKPVNVD